MRNYVILALGFFLSLSSCDKMGKIQVTDSGNQYIVHQNGTGDVVAQTGYYAYVHATLVANDSIVFDTRSNEAEPTAVQIPDSENISPTGAGPVEDVLRGRKAGDSLTIIMRLDTLEVKPPGLEDVDKLYYHLMVKEVVDAETYAMRMAEKQAELEAAMQVLMARETEVLDLAETTRNDYLSGTLEGLQTTPSGLKYVIHEEGDGQQATAGDIAMAHYVGKLVENGEVFDQSFQRGRGIQFPIGDGRVIMGWDEGFLLLKEGTKASFFIPSELAYGAEGTPDGTIPANAELMFYVELEGLN